MSAGTMCGGRLWLLDRDAVVSPVDYVAYFQVIGTSADTSALIIISWTGLDYQISQTDHQL